MALALALAGCAPIDAFTGVSGLLTSKYIKGGGSPFPRAWKLSPRTPPQLLSTTLLAPDLVPIFSICCFLWQGDIRRGVGFGRMSEISIELFGDFPIVGKTHQQVLVGNRMHTVYQGISITNCAIGC